MKRNVKVSPIGRGSLATRISSAANLDRPHSS